MKSSVGILLTLCVVCSAVATAEEIKPGILRTPDERFENLPGFDFEPHYIEIGDYRVHYLDEGPADGQIVFMLHGEPTWSYLSCILRVDTDKLCGRGIQERSEITMTWEYKTIQLNSPVSDYSAKRAEEVRSSLEPLLNQAGVRTVRHGPVCRHLSTSPTAAASASTR